MSRKNSNSIKKFYLTVPAAGFRGQWNKLGFARLIGQSPRPPRLRGGCPKGGGSMPGEDIMISFYQREQPLFYLFP